MPFVEQTLKKTQRTFPYISHINHHSTTSSVPTFSSSSILLRSATTDFWLSSSFPWKLGILGADSSTNVTMTIGNPRKKEVLAFGNQHEIISCYCVTVLFPPLDSRRLRLKAFFTANLIWSIHLPNSKSPWAAWFLLSLLPFGTPKSPCNGKSQDVLKGVNVQLLCFRGKWWSWNLGGNDS